MSDDTKGGDAAEERRERVARRAHEIWERAGRPHGQDVAHWQEAEDEIEAEDEGDRSADRAAANVNVAKPATTRRGGKK